MIDDSELLRRYADQRAEDAFAELVRRHVDLVHSAALRQTNGDVHLACDATQLVFADLARKAARLSHHRVLAGWLFVSTRYAAGKLVRAEQRRRAREQEARTMNELNGVGGIKPDWRSVRPVLDEAMSELGATDRAAILLRFFEGRGFADIGARLRLNENSARMRVERALAKLHGLLARRGVTSTTGALAVVLAEQAVTAAPAGLAASVTGAALAGGTGAVAGGVVTFMGLTKLQLGLAGALAVAGAGLLVSQQQDIAELQREIAGLRTDESGSAALRAENRTLAETIANESRWREAQASVSGLQAEERELRERLATARQASMAAGQGGAKGGQPVITAKADQLPKVSQSTRPVYPAEMRAQGIPGEVLVEFVVGADGRAHEVAAVESTHPAFEEAAVAAVAQWKFDPGVKGGKAVNTRLKMAIKFSLPESQTEPGEMKPVAAANWF